VRIERLERSEVERLGPAGTAASLRARVPSRASVEGAVREIIARVQTDGDAALTELVRRHDTRGATPRPLRVSSEELDRAIRTLSLDVVAGLQVAIANLAEVAQHSVGEEAEVSLVQGQRIVLREIPVGSAAVYAPGGRAPYMSTVVMGVVSARAAGVSEVSVCAPPGPDGEVHPAILGVCRLCGVATVYRMGGAHAVAALAHGTETVTAVDVIVGPGSLWVQEAKRQLSAVVGIDGFAGPSDLLVVMAQDADPRLVALDLMAQAEHGAETLVGALCPSAETLEMLAAELADLARVHAEIRPAACVLVHVPDVEGAVQVANHFAPEHLQLVGAAAERLASSVRTAGCLFVGAASATAFGDYVAGSNHVLPTGGAARFSSALSVRHFRRRMAEVHIGGGATTLARAGAPVARAEGFEMHAQSMEARSQPGPGPTSGERP